jgi:hypothetical protein
MALKCRKFPSVVAAFALVGCNNSPGHKIPAASPVGPGKIVVAKNNSDIPKLQFQVTIQTDGKGPVHNLVRTEDALTKSTVIEWKGASSFYVFFDPNHNPCVKSVGGDGNIYKSTKDPIAGYLAKCSISKTSDTDTAIYYYKVFPGDLAFDKFSVGLGDHCEGCLILAK